MTLNVDFARRLILALSRVGLWIYSFVIVLSLGSIVFKEIKDLDICPRYEACRTPQTFSDYLTALQQPATQVISDEGKSCTKDADCEGHNCENIGSLEHGACRRREKGGLGCFNLSYESYLADPAHNRTI